MSWIWCSIASGLGGLAMFVACYRAFGPDHPILFIGTFFGGMIGVLLWAIVNHRQERGG